MVARNVPVALRLGRRVDGDRYRVLQPHGRAQQLAPHPHQCRGREGAAIAGNQAADDCRLARRLMGGDAPVVALVRRDAGDEVEPLDQKILQPVVNLVDASAQLFEIGRDI